MNLTPREHPQLLAFLQNYSLRRKGECVWNEVVIKLSTHLSKFHTLKGSIEEVVVISFNDLFENASFALDNANQPKAGIEDLRIFFAFLNLSQFGAYGLGTRARRWTMMIQQSTYCIL